MRNPRIASGTVVRIVAATLALGLVVLVGASVGTETAAPTESPVGNGEAVRLAPVTTAATVAVAATAQPRRRISVLGGTVTLHLRRIDLHGSPVAGGTQIDWDILAVVSTGDNLGLALISVDLVQNPTNAAFFDIPLADRPMGAGGMDKFDRPQGISNPDASGNGSAYGGTQIGAPGATNLIQIGGAQNIFGETFSGVLEDATIEAEVGQEPSGVGRVIATGSFPAPFAIGPYTFDLSDGWANTLLDENTPPAYSRVSGATVDVLTFGSFSFMVQ